MNTVYQNASGKAARRLIPFLILCYFVAFLDRVNAGFACWIGRSAGFSPLRMRPVSIQSAEPRCFSNARTPSKRRPSHDANLCSA